MYRYFDPDEDSFLKDDETYQRIIKQLNPFISNLNSEEDKQLILKMLSTCYHRYYKSIKTRSQHDIELMYSTMMALLIEQTGEIVRLG
ncbi:hypothetical protein [Candidatus Nitrosocosmicus sp. SS]|jgi:hypothetical protein|uniref:hypothetical protein n=1 Tax=Candidatus Nitrosocosmicus agrestis TaxID=2563600 RepID=UPI00122E5139|nr:hypothetical protein [Candidatus Nitrosocosmicus sp. SS]KAA2281169.1 hypothetical protein F1Z66_09615 [Candidatus Nitrosocosmicus sp. SS]KAF0869469.1 hypothetical protein E5N71_05355 [Candidatus Nitrosocosmicus sp. SS]MDR4491849.1 hypothetical protein [Candidatus Nitrosocosmicus sp.]